MTTISGKAVTVNCFSSDVTVLKIGTEILTRRNLSFKIINGDSPPKLVVKIRRRKKPKPTHYSHGPKLKKVVTAHLLIDWFVVSWYRKKNLKISYSL